MKVLKRNGKTEDYNFSKIEQAVKAAFISCNLNIPKMFISNLREMFDGIIFRSNFYNTKDYLKVEDIQDSIEYYLMKEGHYEVAKSYIIYREKHKETRFIRERLDYMEKYITSSDNAASSSETDSNANVTMKNVANLEGEVYKSTNRIIQRQRMKEQLNKLYNSDIAKQYEKDLNHHIIYTHDESSTPVLKNYTYSPFEVVHYKYNGVYGLSSLKSLYNIVLEPEIKQEGNDVWSKFPQDLYVEDVNGYTKVTRLTRKSRYDDLVRVKTSFGEDLIVTANHPLIKSENKEDRVEAKDSEGLSQKRLDSHIEFKGINTLDLASCINYDEVHSNYILTHETHAPYFYTKRFIKLNESLGYVVGFFIGDGNYDNTFNNLIFSQKDKEILEKLSEHLFESFGIVSYIHKNTSNNMYFMKVCSTIVSELFRNFFKIGDKAQNKSIPYNVLEFTPEFTKGIIEGLIDSDGAIDNTGGTVSIRLSSRECIMQLSMLLRYFGYGVGNTINEQPFGTDTEGIHGNYTIWGVVFSNTPNVVKFTGSEKWNKLITREISKGLKYSCGWSKITSVTTVKEGAFLDSCAFIYDITTETHTLKCNNLWVHNCEAVSLYPLMLNGVGDIDGITPTPPNNLDSFCGQFVNLAFLLASQCKGAVAFGGFFIAFNYYCVKEWGNKYYEKDRIIVDNEFCNNRKTIGDKITQAFQQCVWGINQPAGNRGFQSPFINFSYYDSNYFKALFEYFYYPDGTQPEWEAIDYLQKKFMKFLNNERLKAIIAMPVETMALLSDGEDIIDKDYKEFTAEMYAEGHSFFTYISDNPNALSSCCRLKSEIEENTFSFTNGLTGIQTGSINVITLNINRIVQDWYKDKYTDYTKEGKAYSLSLGWKKDLKDYIVPILDRVYKYHIAYKTMLYDIEDKGMLTSSKAGYIYMKKLYSTIGINGINEAAEFLGIECSYNKEYQEFCTLITSTISEQNKIHNIRDNKRPFLFNSEFVPAEDLGIKNYNWDKENGYWVNPDRNLYNSYFYIAHNDTSVLDKFKLHGKEFTSTLDGGVGCHVNLEEHLSKEQYLKLIEYAVKEGTSYFTFNIPNSECEECGHITKHYIHKCPKCNSDSIKWYTRIIGYLKAIDNFSEGRQIEASKRVYSKDVEIC